jgi:hypothetical protein
MVVEVGMATARGSALGAALAVVGGFFWSVVIVGVGRHAGCHKMIAASNWMDKGRDLTPTQWL